MHASRFPARAFKTAASTSRLPSASSQKLPSRAQAQAQAQVHSSPSQSSSSRTHTCRRCFSTTAIACRSAPHDPENGPRPDQRPLADSNHDEPTAAHEDQHQNGPDGVGVGRRSRTQAISSLRSRQARRRNAVDLPPFELPKSFLEQNVILGHHPFRQTMLPFAMEQDLQYEKIAPALPTPKTDEERQIMQRYIDYFVNTLAAVQRRVTELERDLVVNDSNQDMAAHPDGTVTLTLTPFIQKVERILILNSWFHECALQICNGVAPEQSETLQYSSRPFWWWHIWKGLSLTKGIREDQRSILHEMFTKAPVELGLPLSHSLDQCIGDLPKGVIRSLSDRVHADLLNPAPKGYDLKNWKRPISILSLSGYGGKAINESVGLYLAQTIDAHIIRINAWDISVLLGDYIGQNWAYGRGTLSMLGFRCAELNGKIPEEETEYTDEDDPTGTTVDVRAAAGSLEEELNKIKAGSMDVFSKWEALKIDRAIEKILSADHHGQRLSSNTPTIIQIDDIVELSMTMEGNWILSRIRTAVEEMWAQKGRRITVFGTSSCEEPSEDYQSAIEELASNDKVITRHLKFNDMESHGEEDHPGQPRTENPNTIQQVDYFYENMQNIDRMIRAMHPGVEGIPHLPVKELLNVCSNLIPPPSPKQDLRRSILPASEVYALAQFPLKKDLAEFDLGGKNLIEAFYDLGPSQQLPGHPQEYGELSFDHIPIPKPRHSHGGNEDNKPDMLSAHSLNDYEKRILSGRVNRDKLKVTFADVHVPKDTIAALKTLTSLALLRPEAFSYGVLAQDKINGCLLYGPPGTGKTMLAKAVAKECGANMLEISGATINDKYVGESEKLVRAIFTLAKKLSPCVVFLDEADALLANRSLFSSRIAHREQLNQFLKEWDGMEENNAFMMVATNRPFDLDDAVLRRLPRKILVDLPTQADRLAILQIHLRDEQLSPQVSLSDLAARTTLYSGSDLKNVCVAAAMAAVEAEHDAARRYQEEAAAKEAASEDNDEKQPPYEYPARRTLEAEHFEQALKQIPASVSANMGSLKAIRGFDQEYGNRGKVKRGMGFGRGEERKDGDASIRADDGKKP